jgi:sRNA-binding regulator protein Hfq
MIEPGKHVKYFLRNGMVLEGIVEKDTAAEVVLKALDGQSLMILHRPAEDIMMTKVVLAEEMPEEAPDPALVVSVSTNEAMQPGAVIRQEIIQDKLRETLQIEDVDLQRLSIEELRQLVLEQDRQLIANKKKEHFGTPDAPKMTQYSSPYVPMRTVGRRVVPRSAYQPGKIPSWAYGRPPKGK